MATIKISNAFDNQAELLQRFKAIKAKKKWDADCIKNIQSGNWLEVFKNLIYRIEYYSKIKVLNYTKQDQIAISTAVASKPENLEIMAEQMADKISNQQLSVKQIIRIAHDKVISSNFITENTNKYEDSFEGLLNRKSFVTELVKTYFSPICSDNGIRPTKIEIDQFIKSFEPEFGAKNRQRIISEIIQKTLELEAQSNFVLNYLETNNTTFEKASTSDYAFSSQLQQFYEDACNELDYDYSIYYYRPIQAFKEKYSAVQMAAKTPVEVVEETPQSIAQQLSKPVPSTASTKFFDKLSPVGKKIVEKAISQEKSDHSILDWLNNNQITITEALKVKEFNEVVFQTYLLASRIVGPAKKDNSQFIVNGFKEQLILLYIGLTFVPTEETPQAISQQLQQQDGDKIIEDEQATRELIVAEAVRLEAEADYVNSTLKKNHEFYDEAINSGRLQGLSDFFVDACKNLGLNPDEHQDTLDFTMDEFDKIYGETPLDDELIADFIANPKTSKIINKTYQQAYALCKTSTLVETNNAILDLLMVNCDEVNLEDSFDISTNKYNLFLDWGIDQVSEMLEKYPTKLTWKDGEFLVSVKFMK